GLRGCGKRKAFAPLPRAQRPQVTFREFREGWEAYRGAHAPRPGPSDHAVVRRLIEDRAEWSDSPGARAREVKSAANNLRRWVARRQRDALLPDWVYDDEPLPQKRKTGRLREFWQELRAARAGAPATQT